MENTFYFLRDRVKRFAAFFFLLVFTGTAVSCGYSYQSTPHGPSISPLNDWLYRGSQPKEEDLRILREKGVRTVVNFRTEAGWIDWEKKEVEALGIKFISLPWNIMGSVDPRLLDEFFRVLDDPGNRPVYFHCKHGRDRSGVMSVLALMRYDKMSEEEARAFALETIRPNLRYRYFVNQKIEYFLKERPEKFTDASSA